MSSSMGKCEQLMKYGMIDRIVVINDFCHGGGAAALAAGSAVWFRDRGHEVTFISGDAADSPVFSARGIQHIRLGEAGLLEKGKLRAIRDGLFNTRAYRTIADWIDQNDTDRTIYHLHNWSQILSPAVLLATRRVAARLVMSAHDFFLACPNGAYANYRSGRVCSLTPLGLACWATNCDRRNYREKLWRVARQVVVNRIRKSAASRVPVVALHESMIPFLVRGGLSSGSVRVVRNPVARLVEARARCEQNETFLFIGRLHQAKGADLAAKAAQLARVPIVLVGDGPQRSELQRRFPDATIIGWQSSREIAKWLTRARALIIPTRYPEPFGLVAIEALLAGVPVIIASSALLADEILQRGMGYACDPLDTEAMVTLMRRIRDDDELTSRLSESAFENSRELANTPESWTAKLLKLYEELLMGSSWLQSHSCNGKS